MFVVLVTSQRIALIPVHPEVVKVVVPLNSAVVRHHPMVGFRHVRLEDARGDIGMVKRCQDIANVVEKGTDDVLLVLAVLLGEIRRLQAMREAIDCESAVIAAERLHLLHDVPVELGVRMGDDRTDDDVPVLFGRLIHPAKARTRSGVCHAKTLVQIGWPTPWKITPAGNLGPVSDHIQKTTLDNGLRIVTEHLASSRSASIGVWVAVGSRDETPERSGASHFLEHLLFKGTESRSARSVAEAIDGVGGDMNAFTSREHTAFFARVPATHQDMAADLLFDVLANPALRPEDVDAERLVITEELISAYDTPDDVVFISLYDALFAGHPLAREVLGSPDTIEAMTADHIRTFHNEWYTPANLVISAAGDIDHDGLVARAEAHFGGAQPGSRPKRTGAPAVRQEMVGTERPVEQLHVALGWRSLTHGAEQRYELALANQILGGSPSSRLFQSIREDRALAYTVFSQTSGYVDAGSASLYAATSVARGPELMHGLTETMADFVERGVTQAELDRARTGLEGAMVLGLEDSGSRMTRMATGIALRGEITSIDTFLERLRSVTVAGVNDVISTVYGVAPVVSVAGPAAGIAALQNS